MATEIQGLLHAFDGAIAYYEKIHAGWLRHEDARAPISAKLKPWMLLDPGVTGQRPCAAATPCVMATVTSGQNWSG